MFVLILVFFQLSFSFDQKELTEFVWVADSEKPFKGKCFEIDRETRGQKYQIKARPSKCKPEKTIFYWQPKDAAYGGKCFELDAATKGSQYAVSVSDMKCAPKEVTHTWQQTTESNGRCLLVDTRTGGANFSKKVMASKCLEKGMRYIWVPKLKVMSGTCWAIDEASGGQEVRKKVQKKYCKPKRVKYIWQAKADGTGKCYEVDFHNGVEGYLGSVGTSKCEDTSKLSEQQKNSPDRYTWIPNDENGGSCFIAGKSKDGKPYYKMVKYINCLPQKVQNIFIKTHPLKGRCYVVDSQTLGESFKRRIDIKKCRPKDSSLLKNWMGKAEGIKEGCYYFDKETRGQNYVEKISKDKCQEIVGNVEWRPDETGWSGTCVSLMQIGSSLKLKTYPEESCRPKKVIKTWHNFSEMNGACFEIDGIKGNLGFSKKIDSKLCRPEDRSYRFYRPKGKDSGSCYSVDKETMGKKYHKKVSRKKCKELLFKLPVEEKIIIEDY